MALVDDVEFFGRAVDAGDMDREAAVRALCEASGGGLAEVGAGHLIDTWTTARAVYQQGADQARAGLAYWQKRAAEQPDPGSSA